MKFLKTLFDKSIVPGFALFALAAGTARAEGLIHKLPQDGSWAQFELTGERLNTKGDVEATVEGMVTLKSVGTEEVDGSRCRWIELVVEREARARRGMRSRSSDVTKLLIPEKYLAAGENPREHVIKGYRQDIRGVAIELNLKAPAIPALQEFEDYFHGPLAKQEKTASIESQVPGGKFTCVQVSQSAEGPEGEKPLSTKTWLTDDVPFGVAEYRIERPLKRGNELLGSRSLELKFAKSGTDAKSSLTPKSE
jgi:hypothetical protein